MKIYVVIPAHNEAEFIGQTLESLVKQTYPANRIVVVDDNSSDETASIVSDYISEFPTLSLVYNNSSEAHLPGSKVINAFYKGYERLDEDYDVICKFDADLVFPENYLEQIVRLFTADSRTGLAGGYCTILKNGDWQPENLTSKDHLRGALKAYRRECFLEIGKLKRAMGWDTADELLAQFHGWNIKTDPQLPVKHLKPTGGTYNKSSKYKQGESFYSLRYGLTITAIASMKLALRKNEPRLFIDYLNGYLKAKKEKRPFLVSEKEGKYIRKLRWAKMREKLF